MPGAAGPRPPIRFTGASTDAEKIRFFGTLMPALMLVKAAPWQAAALAVRERLTPRGSIDEFIAAQSDVAVRHGNMLIFLHRWRSGSFDPLVFGRAWVFLAQLARLVRRSGYSAETLDPLSPAVNLPRLAAEAGLGNLSPYGLLVHPDFGPRCIISGLKTDYPGGALSRPAEAGGCTDCLACVRQCPQQPHVSGVIDLRQCRACGLCLAICPAGR